MLALVTSLIDSALAVIGLQRISDATATAIMAKTSSQLATTSSSPPSRDSLIRLLWSGNNSLLPWVPKPVKLFLLLMLLINYKSLPLMWHIRIFSTAYYAKLRAKVLGADEFYRRVGLGVGPAFQVGADKNGNIVAKENGNGLELTGKGKEAVYWGNGLLPKGSPTPFKHRFEHPMGVRKAVKCYAGIDDCDFNLHLSNSAYAKNLDYGRMSGLIDCFSPMFPAGGWLALGAASYWFVKEIPVGQEYEVRMSIGGWEDKWLYLIGEFVTYPKGKKKGLKRSSSGITLPESFTAPTSSTVAPLLPEGNNADSSASSPSPSPPNGLANGQDAKKPSGRPPKKEVQIREDGSVLHCFSVSTYCAKVGRITIPPRVLLSFCGYGSTSNWERAQKLLARPDHGKAWLQGGYKDEPERVGAEWDAEAGTAIAEVLARSKKYGDMIKDGLAGLESTVNSVPKF